MHVDVHGGHTSENGRTGGDRPRESAPAADLPEVVAPEALVTRALGLLRGPGSGSGRVILGLAGPPAAGKSTLARHLVEEVARREGPDSAAYLPLDGFHLANAQLDRLGLRARKGAPETFDSEGYLALLRRVTAERFRDIYVPDFDRALDEPVAARHVIRPHTRLVVTEGNYLAAPDAPWSDVRALCRELWYIDADDDLRHRRLIERHTGGGQDQRAATLRIAANDHPNGEYVKAGRATCSWLVRVPDLPAATDGRSVS
ncbi:nucleoside/nucleotide kinase family protein [Streptomyces sp. NRRL B-24484]|uniref:nucleoside/nucleotide kinase family protein n=1 Tax=Streptomyces sp. NRRL B-24484 TaxID=1463833 RepID=UPI000A46F10D|nr:nucleoside/nucleotide kinase family protein [Streptomyces sp. NRRL B-24484]